MEESGKAMSLRAAICSRAATSLRAASSGLAALTLAAAITLTTSGLAAQAQTRPPDIRGHWAEDRIEALIDRSVIALGPDRAFNPDNAVSRGQFIAWLVAARGLPLLRPEARPFPDVAPGSEFASAIETAVTYGIVPAGGTFRPSTPLARGDALVFLVRALGYTFETSYMTNAALPFSDAGGLPPVVRGALAVAALSVPPILREPETTRIRAFDPMTRAEAASLIWGYVQAVEQGISMRFSVTLEPGVTLILEKRGALRTLPLWRVQVGTFVDEGRANRLADEMRARGLPVTIDQLDEFYKVRVGNFATRGEAAALQRRLAGEGLSTALILTVRDYDTLPGPFWSGILLIEPAAGVRLRPALAREVVGRARTSDAARRSGALAAINGGFFNTANGDPLGCLVVDGEVVSDPIPGRTCIGITDDGQLLFDTQRLDASATAEGGTVQITGVNRERGTDEVLLYRPSYGASTRTNDLGAEAIVHGDVVQQVADGRGNSPIPQGGYVLSAHGRSRAVLVAAFKPGDRVTLRARLVPTSGDPRWDGARQVLGGGPRLLANGQYAGGEGFRPGFTDRRHPRTAIGRLADGRIVLMVVGGRQPYHSLGMTLRELALLLQQLGVTDAVNLDGGGSTTLVVRGTVVNLPSDETGERPVSDVLLVMPAANATP